MSFTKTIYDVDGNGDGVGLALSNNIGNMWPLPTCVLVELGCANKLGESARIQVRL